MDYLEAFRKLWKSEGNAARAASVLSQALVIQLAGWERLDLNRNRVHDLRRVFQRAGIDPLAIQFPADDGPHPAPGEELSKREIEALRVAREREFAVIAHNMRGHLYKKTEWRDLREHAGSDDSSEE